jgi:RimJ/RimL family protein N-acetyltransferase
LRNGVASWGNCTAVFSRNQSELIRCSQIPGFVKCFTICRIQRKLSRKCTNQIQEIMELKIEKTNLERIEHLRNLFLSETKFQFIYNKCHAAGWSDVYVFTMNELPIGYGSVWGKDNRESRDTIFEFYLTGPHRKHSNIIFPELLKRSGAIYIESQSNDHLLTRMLFEYAGNINAEAILFEDFFETDQKINGTVFAKNEFSVENSEYKLELEGVIIATGGYVWNYNYPYIDLYYEVNETYRKKGFGSLILQELKKEAYRLNRIPAARCNINNIASQRTLMKAGMRICGYILIGKITDKFAGKVF